MAFHRRFARSPDPGLPASPQPHPRAHRRHEARLPARTGRAQGRGDLEGGASRAQVAAPGPRRPDQAAIGRLAQSLQAIDPSLQASGRLGRRSSATMSDMADLDPAAGCAAGTYTAGTAGSVARLSSTAGLSWSPTASLLSGWALVRPLGNVLAPATQGFQPLLDACNPCIHSTLLIVPRRTGIVVCRRPRSTTDAFVMDSGWERVRGDGGDDRRHD